jgi:hypothetical protein
VPDDSPHPESDTPDDRRDPVFEALWARVLEAWADDKTHTAVLDHALRVQALPELAGRYRALVDDPDKGTLAKKRLDAIVLAATQMLMSMKTPKPGKTPLPITLSAAGISLLLLVWLAWEVWGHRR